MFVLFVYDVYDVQQYFSYIVASVLLVEELEFLEKTADLPQVTDKISSQNVLSSKPCHEGDSNS